MSQRKKLPNRLRFEVLKRDGFACVYCGAAGPAVKMTVDHVIPTTAGGTDDVENLVACCSACNIKKAATIPRAHRDRPDVQAAMARRLAQCRCPECGCGLSDGATIDDGMTKVVYCDFKLCTVGFSGVYSFEERRAIPFTPEQAAQPDAQWVIRLGSRVAA